METIYLSLIAKVAVGTFFMKSPVAKNKQMSSKKRGKIDKKNYSNIAFSEKKPK